MKYLEAKQYLKAGMKVAVQCGAESCLHPKTHNGQGIVSEKNYCWNGIRFDIEDDVEILTNPDGSPWEHPDVKRRNKPWDTQWKVGDLIKCTDTGNNYSDKLTKGKTYKVNKVNANGGVIQDDGGNCLNTWYAEFELVERQLTHFDFYSNNPFDFYENSYKPLIMSGWSNGLAPRKKSFMSSIVRKIKDLTLSADDRILRKHDFENDCKEMTEQTREMMLDEILADRWATRRTEVAEQLRKVEAEEKAA